jgi:hypothetical protein
VPGAAHLANVERADVVTPLLGEFFDVGRDPSGAAVADLASPWPEETR